MFCAKCGKELNEGSEFCSGCGTKVNSSNENQNTSGQPNQTTPVVTQVVAMPTGTAPLVMGLLGLFGGAIPIVQYITGLLSVLAIFIGISQKKKLKAVGLPTGKATAGIVLGLIAVILTVVMITITAAFVGSLFSSGSSKSTTRINALPAEMHGKVFTNGETTLEFGKNKVKLNDKWYRSKKILKDNRYNSSYTIYFSDRYVMLQNMRPIELSYVDKNILNNINVSGLMTPAEIEAEALKREKIVKEIVGIWEGSFNFDNFISGATLDMTLDISYENKEFISKLNFEVKSSYGSPKMQINSKGESLMNFEYSDGNYTFHTSKWLMGHSDTSNITFVGKLSDNVLSGKLRYYGMRIYGEGNFKTVKKN